jgi:PhzF family phenazine biosynthesis protein
MEVPIFQVDAFTEEPFKGNPAAVCFLDQSRSDEWMQRVASEMNLSQTAFVLARGGEFDLRWFTPTVEVPLCGHATLASAHVLWETGRINAEDPARFQTRSGPLAARRRDGRIELDFPAIPLAEASLPDDALAALGLRPRYVGRTPGGDDWNFLLELDGEEAVRQAQPDFERLRRAIPAGVIITARAASASYDFVSRYFAPHAGINEDPVTGVAHCSLAHYWSRRLSKPKLVGYQASQRGGVVRVEPVGDRVLLSGEAVTVLRGVLLR